MQTYAAIQYVDSNNSRRRGLCGWFYNRKTRRNEYRSHTTIQVFRDSHGSPLPHQPLLLKRNKYVPHIGKKHAAKLALRA